VAAAIGKVKGVVDVLNGIENTISGPSVSYQVDPTASARAGFSTQEVATDAAAMVQGVPASVPMVVKDRPYTVRIRFPGAENQDAAGLASTLINSASSHTATLGSLATLTTMPGEREIRRENLQQLVTVTARLEGVDLGSAIVNVKKAVSDLHLPADMRVQYGGTYEEQQQSFHDLTKVLVLALLLVFTVLLFEFRTFAAPVAIITSAVFSTSGVLLALLITNTSFNIASFMGLIMVIGIVAKNGILLLDAENRFISLGMSRRQAIVQSGRRRLRPIVMTAMAAVAGMLPLALALGAGAEMLQPLAIAVIGGILISMALSLIITPTVHYYLSRSHEIQ
jgi:multidrug efflux pump subunit AcrB